MRPASGLRYGDRLDDLIGQRNAVEFICNAMRSRVGRAARAPLAPRHPR